MTRLVTKEGLKKLHDELEDRRGRRRQEIAQAIKEAKEQGDLSENAEYSEAKRQQGENESRIAELEGVVKDIQVVERDKNVKGIQMGSRVKVKFNGSSMDFEIVSSNESDPDNFKISNESPIGRCFMGKNVGDKVSADTPRGKAEYYILEIN